VSGSGVSIRTGGWADFYGPNAGYVLDLYEQFLQDANSVDPQTRAFFERWRPPDTRGRMAGDERTTADEKKNTDQRDRGIKTRVVDLGSSETTPKEDDDSNRERQMEASKLVYSVYANRARFVVRSFVRSFVL